MVGEKPNQPTRYLIDKFSGKFNINRRYRNNCSAAEFKKEEQPDQCATEMQEQEHEVAAFP